MTAYPDTSFLCAMYRFQGSQGHRVFDILHIATALHLGAAEFLTFDAHQKQLAGAEGLHVPFKPLL
jgi:predicted nucleic acid-binding protein